MDVAHTKNRTYNTEVNLSRYTTFTQIKFSFNMRLILSCNCNPQIMNEMSGGRGRKKQATKQVR